MLEPTPPRAVSWRSILLGLFGTTFICALTPYNDYALNNTFLVGNNLPLGVLLVMFAFAILINGPLSKWKPDRALSSGELAVAMAMMLVACCIPSSGLMRYWPGSLVAPFWHARSDARYQAILESAKLPDWLYPAFSSPKRADWMSDPIVTGFMTRWSEALPFPYRAWIQPALIWGIFFIAFAVTMLCICAIVRRQWFENERLAFPLAQIELALIEQPQRGNFLNTTLRYKSFWIGFTCVFLIHLWNGFHEYFPKFFAEIPLGYDLRNVLSNDPWRFTDELFRKNRLFLTGACVMLFVSTPISFSLWFFFVADQIRRMIAGSTMGDPNNPGQSDQHLGGVLAFAIAILWVGRNHWKLVLAQAIRGEKPGEPRGRYLSYRAAFWGMVGGIFVMILWLCLSGTSVIGAVVILLMLLIPLFVLTRIVAETGLMHGQLNAPIFRPWDMLSYYGFKSPVSMETYMMSGYFQVSTYDYREVLPVYATHGIKLTDSTHFQSSMALDTDNDRRTGRKILLCMMLALVVGFVVSLRSMLWTEYTFYSAKDAAQTTPISLWGAQDNSKSNVLEATRRYNEQNYNYPTDPLANLGGGFAFTSVLSFLRLRYTWWPLHPIGFLMIGRFPGMRLWFSFFVGWLVKVILLKFGGARLYQNAKPLFLGIILGDCISGGIWLLAGVGLSAFDVTYRPVMVMPE